MPHMEEWPKALLCTRNEQNIVENNIGLIKLIICKFWGILQNNF